MRCLIINHHPCHYLVQHYSNIEVWQKHFLDDTLFLRNPAGKQGNDECRMGMKKEIE